MVRTKILILGAIFHIISHSKYFSETNLLDTNNLLQYVKNDEDGMYKGNLKKTKETSQAVC